MGFSSRFIEGFTSINRGGIPEGWSCLVLMGIPPFGRILRSSILVVPLVTSKIIGLAGEIRIKEFLSKPGWVSSSIY